MMSLTAGVERLLVTTLRHVHELSLQRMLQLDVSDDLAARKRIDSSRSCPSRSQWASTVARPVAVIDAVVVGIRPPKDFSTETEPARTLAAVTPETSAHSA
jgi:hypothetical protein